MKTREKIPYNPQVSVPRLFAPSNTIIKLISSISSTITRVVSNENIKSSNRGLGFVSDVENQVTTETNADLTEEDKDRLSQQITVIFCSIVVTLITDSLSNLKSLEESIINVLEEEYKFP